MIYGRVITEQGYKNGEVAFSKRKTEESIDITSNQHLLSQIFHQLEKLKDCGEITFTIKADKHTHQPYRMVTLTEEAL